MAQPADYFLFSWEEKMNSAENPITIGEDEGVLERMTPPALLLPPALEPRSALRSIKNLQNSTSLCLITFIQMLCLKLISFFVNNQFPQFKFNFENR